MDIRQSLKQILYESDTFVESFYEAFLNSCPEAKVYFEGVNMKRQAAVLTMGLVIVVKHYLSSYPVTEMYLQYLGTKHHDRSIPQELYEKWVDALLKSIQSFHGDDWSDELAGQWHEAVGLAIEVMFDGYENRFHP